MSIHLISQAWKTQVSSLAAKLVLLKLADNASDEGKAWPHIDTIAAETGLARSSVFRALDELEKSGLVERHRGRNEVIYQIQKSHSETSTSPTVRPQKSHHETSTGPTMGLTLTKEPSREHIGETSEKKRFKKPSVADVLAYGSSLTPKFLKAQQFLDYYESKGWVVGKSPMKCWKSAVRTWQARDKQTTRPQTSDQFGI
jgi:DNA-binding transcriptional regulator YhcF (GntR family)